MAIHLTALADLFEEYNAQPIPYARLLETEEWDKRREEILERDQYCCSICKPEATENGGDIHFWVYQDRFGNGHTKRDDKPYHLEVHHSTIYTKKCHGLTLTKPLSRYVIGATQKRILRHQYQFIIVLDKR